jgi:hypothetical protein
MIRRRVACRPPVAAKSSRWSGWHAMCWYCVHVTPNDLEMKEAEAMMTTMQRFIGLMGVSLLIGTLAGCDMDVEERGELPEVDVDAQEGEMPDVDVDVEDQGELPSVDVDAEEGEMPEVDVQGPDVDVSAEEEEVTVPDIDVGTEEAEVTVPDVDVDVPE